MLVFLTISTCVVLIHHNLPRHVVKTTDIDLSKENPFKTTWLSPGSQIKSYVSASVTGLHSLESEVDILLVDLLNTD